MTITDEELYRLAKELKERRRNFSNGPVTETKTDQFIADVLQRFKPREPRVIERFVQVLNGQVVWLHTDRQPLTESIGVTGGYLAKAVITEVMEGE